MGCCIRGLLLASSLALAISGGFATFWSYYDFPSGENHSLVPPENRTITKTNSWGNEETKNTEEWSSYVNAKRNSANYYRDSRLYVIIPGGINTLASVVLIVACLFSRKVFTSTAVLYNAVSLWIVTLAVTICFQYAASPLLQEKDDFKPYFFWIMSFHILHIVMLTFQILIAGIELRQQKVTWPTVNISHLITPSTVLLAATMTLSVFSLIVFCDSPFIEGVVDRILNDYWSNPRERVPDYFVFPSILTLCYGAVVSAENILSHLLGKVHTRLMAVTSILSGVLYCCVAVITSPSMLVIITGHSSYYDATMGFVLGVGLVSILHGILCLVVPKRMVSPPSFVKKIAEQATAALNGGISNIDFKQFSTLPLQAGSVMPLIKNNLSVYGDLIVLLFCGISLIMGSVAIDGPGSSFATVTIVGDCMVLSRIIPSILNRIYGTPEQLSSFKVKLQIILEVVLALVGAIGSFCSWRSLMHGVGVIKIFIFVILMKSLPVTVSGAKAALSALVENQGCEDNKDTEQLVPEQEEHTEPKNDDSTLPQV